MIQTRGAIKRRRWQYLMSKLVCFLIRLTITRDVGLLVQQDLVDDVMAYMLDDERKAQYGLAEVTFLFHEPDLWDNKKVNLHFHVRIVSDRAAIAG